MKTQNDVNNLLQLKVISGRTNGQAGTFKIAFTAYLKRKYE